MNGSNGTWNVKGRERNPRPFDIPHGLQIPCKLLAFLMRSPVKRCFTNSPRRSAPGAFFSAVE